MNISDFIQNRTESILMEWEVFAKTFGAVTSNMSSVDLRNHARQILDFVAKDIATAESAEQATSKSRGGVTPRLECDDSASAIHGRMRYASGFTLLQLIAEYRALRASVLRLWRKEGDIDPADRLDDMTRFNEAIDQSLSEAAVAYTAKLNETRDMFLAILGHDLRSPLAAAMTAGTYLAQPGRHDEEVRQVGLRVKRSAVTMSGMVDDLLALARTQLGDGIAVERRQCDLVEMSRWAIGDANAGHPLAIFQLEAPRELIGNFDQLRLQQLVTNLANNAAQYGTPGKPIIIVVGCEERHAFIKVRNEGATIPMKALPNLFSPLVQLPEQPGNERPRSSLGLGLFIAKQIAIAHGGSIDVTSDEVAGTEFTVRLPQMS